MERKEVVVVLPERLVRERQDIIDDWEGCHPVDADDEEMYEVLEKIREHERGIAQYCNVRYARMDMLDRKYHVYHDDTIFTVDLERGALSEFVDYDILRERLLVEPGPEFALAMVAIDSLSAVQGEKVPQDELVVEQEVKRIVGLLPNLHPVLGELKLLNYAVASNRLYLVAGYEFPF